MSTVPVSTAHRKLTTRPCLNTTTIKLTWTISVSFTIPSMTTFSCCRAFAYRKTIRVKKLFWEERDKYPLRSTILILTIPTVHLQQRQAIFYILPDPIPEKDRRSMLRILIIDLCT